MHNVEAMEFRGGFDESNPYNTYTAVTKQDGDWWIGWIEEIPGVNCQERTKEQLLKSLKATMSEALKFNREDALAEERVRDIWQYRE